MPPAGYVWTGGSGCLLPLLIILNLFFGKLIFKDTGLWLGVGAVLVLIFMLKIKLMVSRVSKLFRSQGQDVRHNSSGKVIDIQGEDVEDERKLPA